MLNLLIAIISDSFEKVMALNLQSENYEKLQLILEYEAKAGHQALERYLLENKGKYIYFIKFGDNGEEQDADERLRSKIDKMKKNHDDFVKDFKKYQLKEEEFKKMILAELRTQKQNPIKINREEEEEEQKPNVLDKDLSSIEKE